MCGGLPRTAPIQLALLQDAHMYGIDTIQLALLQDAHMHGIDTSFLSYGCRVLNPSINGSTKFVGVAEIKPIH